MVGAGRLRTGEGNPAHGDRQDFSKLELRKQFKGYQPAAGHGCEAVAMHVRLAMHACIAVRVGAVL